MAITFTSIANGETLLSIRNKINSWGTTVQDTVNGLLTSVAANTANISINTTAISDNTTNIGTNTTDIADHETRLSAAEVSVGELINIGVSHLIASTPPLTNSLTTSPTKLNWSDMVHHEYGTTVTGNATTDEFTINTIGVYKVFGTIQFEAPNGSEIIFALYKNGVEFIGNLLAIGKGTGKPVNVVYTTIDNFVATDVLSVYATGDSSFDIDIVGASIIVEKTPYPLT